MKILQSYFEQNFFLTLYIYIKYAIVHVTVTELPAITVCIMHIDGTKNSCVFVSLGKIFTSCWLFLILFVVLL